MFNHRVSNSEWNLIFYEVELVTISVKISELVTRGVTSYYVTRFRNSRIPNLMTVQFIKIIFPYYCLNFLGMRHTTRVFNMVCVGAWEFNRKPFPSRPVYRTFESLNDSVNQHPYQEINILVRAFWEKSPASSSVYINKSLKYCCVRDKCCNEEDSWLLTDENEKIVFSEI